MDLGRISDWKYHLQDEFEKKYFKELACFVEAEYKATTCYPVYNDIFNAFKYCSFKDCRVVILGQDPYHGPGQANGLCFSVQDQMPHPPSLVNIFKELEADVEKPYPLSGNLQPWATQGVLLLNATLTVRAYQAGSHQKRGWETFTDQVITTISKHKSNVVFMLWGAYAKRKAKLIDPIKHSILTSGHPSPLSANRGYWFGNKHFSGCNQLLKSCGGEPIHW